VNTTVYQTSHDLLGQLLRKVLADGVQAGRGATEGIGSIECRAVAALCLLLMDHSIDQRGHCRSCRPPGAVFGLRWRRCQVHAKAALCLHQLDEVLLMDVLADELGLATAPPPAPGVAPGRAPAGDPDDTDVLPAIAADPPPQPLQTPATSPLPAESAGRGEVAGPRSRRGRGAFPDSPRFRRGPSDNPAPCSGWSLQLTGGVRWLS
jgi:hypothetical protein